VLIGSSLETLTELLQVVADVTFSRRNELSERPQFRTSFDFHYDLIRVVLSA
jgi:hypothetical protein